MRPSSFEYSAPTTIAEAIALLDGDDSAKALAGGQSLVPLMNLRLAGPSRVVDINAIQDLDRIEVADGHLRIGSLTRHRTLERSAVVQEMVPILAEAAALIGHPQVRNRGTIGGSLAHADPAAELATTLTTLEAVVVVEGAAGRRTVTVADLVEGFMTTTLDQSELIREILVPIRQQGRGFRVDEVAPRPSDFAMVIVAVCVDVDQQGVCERVRVTAGGVGSAPIDISSPFEQLVGSTELLEGGLRQAAATAAELIDPYDDLRATADDRKDLLQVLLARALPVAWQRARS